jgi:flagella basal body P-ring formation protein FlgA
VLTAADVAAPPGSPDSALVGWVTRRTLAAGEPLVPPAVAPPPVVRRGQTVVARYASGGVDVALRGTAMSDAPAGGRLFVRIDARRRLVAVADGPARVRLVTLPGAPRAAATLP